MTEKTHIKIATKIVTTVVSQKGGCGKSFKTRCLAQVGRFWGHEVAVFDGDAQIGTTHRALGARDAAGKLLAGQDPLIGAGRYSLRLDGQREELLKGHRRLRREHLEPGARSPGRGCQERVE